MKLKNKDFIGTLFVNIFILGFIFSILEILFSKYFFFSPALNIPEAQVDVKKEYDTSKLEFPRDIKRSTYTRDKNGYRPYSKNFEDKGIILTVGGSTTDQRFIDDNRTWQSNLEKELNLAVINGGVDGQTSYGHTFSIEKWHSKVLKSEKVDAIIFYVGINDRRFEKGLETISGNIYDSPTPLRRLRTYLSKRSYFYSKFREVKNKLDFILGKETDLPDGIEKIGHNLQNPNFLLKPRKSNYLMSEVNMINPYERLFEKLINVSINNFPYASINIVQQQDPKCLIDKLENNSIYIRVSRKEMQGIDKYCSGLASIYKAQEKVVKELKNQKINLIKMYLYNPVPDNGFYDGLHTNSLGAKYISRYLKDQLKIKFK